MTFVPISETIKQESWRGPAKGVFLSLRIEKVLSKLFSRLPSSTANQVRMLSYREGKLNLVTSSPTVSQEIYLNSTILIRRLNESLGGKIIKKIGFRTAAAPALSREDKRGPLASEREPDLAAN